MAKPGASAMRLTIQVLPLAKEDARGRNTSRALECFKGRKFALPVRWEDTFAQVWQKIEQRHLENYLDAQQAAMFSIKKLQDAYDCDLDLRDTVSAIFGSETDPAMRMIKVVPAFVGRDFSVPITTHLRPASAQKRTRQHEEEPVNKRRRVRQIHNERDSVGLSRDQPVPSTENSRNGSLEHAEQHNPQTEGLTRRSRTVDSVVFTHDVRTGQAEFAPQIKQEPSPPSRPVPQVKPTTKLQNGRRDGRASSSRRPSSKPLPADSQNETGAVDFPTNGIEHHEQLQDADSQDHVPETQIHQEHEEEQEQDRLRSPQSTPLETRPTPSRATHDDLEAPSSPDFIHQSNTTPKSRMTYSRTPRTTEKRKDLYDISSSPEEARPTNLTGQSPPDTNTVQSETNLLNASRRPPKNDVVPPVSSSKSTDVSDDRYENMNLSDLRKAVEDRGLPAKGYTKTLLKLIRHDDLKKRNLTSEFSTPAKKRSGLMNSAVVQSAPSKHSNLTPTTAKKRGRPIKSALVQPASSRKPVAIIPAVETSIPFPTPAKQHSRPRKPNDVKTTHREEASPASIVDTETLDPLTANHDHAQALSLENEEPPATTAHLNDESWGFSALDQQKSPEANNAEAPPTETNGTFRTSFDAHDSPDFESDSGSDLVPARKPDATSRSRSGSFASLTGPKQKEDDEMEDAEQLIQAELNGHAHSAPDEASNDEFDATPAPVAGSRSRSASAAVSTRSSPAVSRRPARFLSRSPSRGESASESESNENENLKSPQRTPPTVEVVSIDSDSESSDESSSEEEEDGEAPAASAAELPAATTTTASQALPSSPPNLPNAASQIPLPLQSAQRPPSESQSQSQSQSQSHVIQRTPIPLPSNVSKSSQSVSARAAATRPKLAGRRSDFPSLSELVADTKKPPTPTVQKKAFDPRSMSLNKLVGKVLKGNVGAWENMNAGGESGTSEDEESSEDSE
ncbi:hypothetical protein DE146DRAFT_631429 [Phaeosphaeria sp. MPI-PUGE-AT-0046c]|nr:hypothetical protein DE146DRAFT_631429 [Phaeosphaeria sp. MPI-PUGE-AT-0046c]